MHYTDRLNVENLLEGITYALGIALVAFTLYYAATQALFRQRYVNIFFGIGITLFYVSHLKKRYVDGEFGFQVRGDTNSQTARTIVKRLDLLLVFPLIVLTIITTAYVEMNFDYLFETARIAGYSETDINVGLILVVIAIDATRRAYGNLIAGVTAGSLIYAYFGPAFPGLLRHTGMDIYQISREGAIGFNGVYHDTLMGIGATWVAIFIMFAGIAKSYGLMDYLLEVGDELRNRLRTGVVHVAIISSMVMGSITGSAAANTATTGSFTIPMMKNQGIKSEIAAAIEAVASSGGQILPPVMGVAAFLMADIIGVSYVRIVQAGLVPALLFYVSIGLGTHLVVLKYGWVSEQTGKFDTKKILINGAPFAIPLAVLVYTLIVLRFTPLSAGMYSIFAIIPVMFLTDVIYDGAAAETLWGTAKRTIVGIKTGGEDMAPLVGVLAAMGIIIEMLTQTGLAQKTSATIIGLGGEILLPILIMAMIASILFGLGMPTPAAYILVVILVAPAMRQVGVPIITAHMFVFYFAILSAITPPVAIAVAIGSRIADSSFPKTSLKALALGLPGFVIPYTFITNRSLLYWSFPETPIVVLIMIIGVSALVISIIGYDGMRELGYGQRVGYCAAAFVAFFAPFIAQIVAVVAVLGSIAITRARFEGVLMDEPE